MTTEQEKFVFTKEDAPSALNDNEAILWVAGANKAKAFMEVKLQACAEHKDREIAELRDMVQKT